MTRAKPSTTRQAVLRHLRPSDLQAAVRLATQATTGVIGIAEGVHQSVRRKMGLSAGAENDRTGGLTGQIYRGIRGVTAMVGHGLDGALSTLVPLLDDPSTHPDPSPGREAVLAALNGVMGDRLLAHNNPLVQRMELRLAGQALPMERPTHLRERLAGASPHLLLLVHGLCMNDTQWHRNGHDHGVFLAQALGCTPVYARYNSGLHTSINGRELAGQLERLVAHWPALESITVLGHSMGGLLARAAVLYGRQMGHRWPAQLKHLVFLGTPHHGAPLERAGHGVDVLLSASPFTLPFTRLGMLRSAGITDLRHGHVLDDDWPACRCPCPRAWPASPWPPRWPPSAACWPTGSRVMGWCHCAARWASTTRPRAAWCLPKTASAPCTARVTWSCSPAWWWRSSWCSGLHRWRLKSTEPSQRSRPASCHAR